MSNPFHNWRSPARPCMWSEDYYKHEHVKRINETITHYQDGLLTTAELANQVFNQYAIGYTLGLEDANYPMPAIPQRRTFKTLYNLGWVSALNEFDVDTVFDNHIKL